LETEKNPDIISEALQALGSYGAPETQERLLAALRVDSYRNTVADGSVRGLRRSEDPRVVPAMLEALRERESAYTAEGWAAALETLAHLARTREDKQPVREFVAGFLSHRRERVRLGAIGALGALGDLQAMGPLQEWAEAGAQRPERDAAREALKRLRTTTPVPEEVQTLRQEVQELRDAQQDLAKQIDELRQKATSAPPAEVPLPKPAKKARGAR
jgi:HEAT repeat protein